MKNLKVAKTLNPDKEIPMELESTEFDLHQKIMPDTWLNVPDFFGEAFYEIINFLP